eukprot:7579355-Lingulodinium_polyedra.AAC.1
MAASGTTGCAAIAAAGASSIAGPGAHGTPRTPSKIAQATRWPSGNRRKLRASPTDPSGRPTMTSADCTATPRTMPGA